MSEGFGPAAWLPLAVQRAQAAEEQAERREAREAEQARAERAESRRSADLQMYRSQCEQRGEAVDVLALATGQVSGRSVSEILADALAMSDREDARAAAAERRERGERIEFVGELAPAARSTPATPAGRKMARRAERFTRSLETRQAADAARAELEDDMPGLYRPRARSEPVPGGPSAGDTGSHADRVRVRGGGPIVGVW